ncbi:MAG: ABC transporter permease [Betaproteobacteria bacterium]|nr:ABC transporter permease [Betaproteobacteria bacterium]
MLRLFLVLNARLALRSGRILLSVAGIALGVALGFAVHLINRAAADEFALAVRSVAGEADFEVRAGRAGFAESLYAVLSRLPGIAVASPVVEIEAAVDGGRGALKVLGLDSLRAAQVQTRLFADDPQRIFALLEPDAVLLSAQAAAAFSLGEGDRLALVVGLERVELRVAGVLPAETVRGRIALADIATAQWRLGRLGTLNRIDLRLAPGSDPAAMRARVEALLPSGAYVTRVETREEQGAKLSRAYRVNLSVLAMVALFTGGFLVFSAQALETARRRGEHGLLRVLGLTRGGVARLVLVEAAAIGVLGSAVGLALGYALASLALRTAGADLGAGMFRGVSAELRFPWLAGAVFFVVGVAIALAGALLPALDAARAAPARALRSGDDQRMFERLVSVWPGFALLAGGGLLTLPGPVQGIPLFGYAAIALILLGGILLMPRAAIAAFAWAGMPRSVPLGLALAQLRGAPGQAMVSLASIVASFALMVAMAIMVSSFRQSVDTWLNAVLPADYYFRTSHAGETVYVDAAFEARVRALPQVERLELQRSERLTLDPARPTVWLVARDMAGGGVNGGAKGGDPLLPVVGERYARKPGDPPPVWISEAMADLYGYAPGRRIELPLGGAPRAFVVEAVLRDYARQHGAVFIERAEYVRLTGDERANDGALWLRPGASTAELAAALRALPGGAQLDMADPGEIRKVSLSVFDRSFAVTYLLEAVAVLVGLFGLSSSLGAIVLARKREFGMLRHIGMTRGQIGAMLAAEGGLLAGFGAFAGLAVGWAIGLVLIHVVNRQSFNWSMELHLPWGLLAALSAVLVTLAVHTAWLSGREAMGMGPVRAVREDW